MTVLNETSTSLPVGTWTSDPAHSSFEFAVRHLVVSTFRGEVRDFAATLAVDAHGARLEGRGAVASIRTQDESLHGHLLSPEFFDAERHPEVVFRSRSVTREGDTLVAAGELEIKGIARPVELRGEVAGPVEDPWGGTRLGVELAGTIDRTEFDLRWNAPLPGGGFVLADDVRLTARLELRREA